MTKLKIFLTSLAIAFFSVQPILASASCTLNGRIVPCNEMPGWFKWITALFIGLQLIFFPLMLLFFIFWIIMLIDAIKYQEENKLMWVLIIALLNVLGAIIYYFVEKRKRKLQNVK